jgi:type IV pilus assembly protein PilQ
MFKIMKPHTSPNASPAGQPDRLWTVLLLALLWLSTTPLSAAENALKDIKFSALPGDQVQFVLTMEGPADEPVAFTIDDPARIALDLMGTTNALDDRSSDVGIGAARSVNVAEAGGRTRVVINLSELVPFDTRAVGNELIVTLQSAGSATPYAPSAAATAAQNIVTAARSSTVDSQGAAAQQPVDTGVVDIDFRRGTKGEGRVLVQLADPSIITDVRMEGGDILVDFLNTELPPRLERRLDVIDFGTPITTIDTLQQGSNVRMIISASGEYEHLAYQADDRLTVEIKPLTRDEAEERRKDKFGYTGQRLSLNFQDIEVRSVLQLLADFTGLNMVVSDSVTGSLTLRLQNVPWDQALDIILKTKGLDKRQAGNVITVAPAAEIAAREQQELEAMKAQEELAPLRTEFVRVNYAKAADIAAILAQEGNSILSTRGTVTIDQRTNTLLVRDTDENLSGVRRLLNVLDIPVRQVLIESRIVIASDDFNRDLGVRFGVTNSNLNSANVPNAVTGNLSGTTDLINGDPLELTDSLNVNLPIANPAGSFGLALAKLPLGTLLELEISAAQQEGKAEVVSSPRVITANQSEARIEQGVEIPFQEASSSGATSTQFKKAVLSLTVTPQITPDDRVVMDLEVTKDNVGQVFGGIPSIDTRQVQTSVLVDNGQTVVLGGIYETETADSVRRVPFFSDLPLLGVLFRQTNKVDNKNELLVFVTPKILKEQLTVSR